MNLLFKQATIVDKRHALNGKKQDVLVVDGTIEKISESIESNDAIIVEDEGLCISIGWMDLRANFRDPGHEHKEDMDSGLRAAAHGGFTAVGLSPATTPPVDNKGAVEYALNRSKRSAVEIFPIGAVSKSLQGESLAEMYDMYLAGAVAFGDAKKPISESGLLHRALLYTKNFDATVLHFPFDEKLIPNGQMNEGIQAVKMGLRGIPAIAEEMAVNRDLTLLEYTEGRLHLGPLSSPCSVEKVQEARNKGLIVSCEVALANLVYNDLQLEGYDTNFKVMPPLRTEAERETLVKYLENGLIDVVSSDHLPEDEEHKTLEFEYASFGMAGIECFFPLLWKACKSKVSLANLIATFSINPREIIGAKVPEIKAGEAANLTVFSTAGSSVFEKTGMKSKGVNKPESGNKLEGRVLGVLNRNQWIPTGY